MITPTDIRSYVVNLRRRPDRRNRMADTLPACLTVTFTSDWSNETTDPFDGHQLDLNCLAAREVTLFPWQIRSDNPWWNRPLKYGEVGCTLAHLACWRHAAQSGDEPFILILEDDAILAPSFLDDLLTGLRGSGGRHGFDLLYLGRDQLEPDRPIQSGLVSPGYSHCSFAYLLTRQALPVLLATQLDQAVVPVDEFLPALYLDHPRADLRGRFPRQLTALAFDPPLAHQRPKHEAGSDTEDSDFVSA